VNDEKPTIGRQLALYEIATRLKASMDAVSTIGRQGVREGLALYARALSAYPS